MVEKSVNRYLSKPGVEAGFASEFAEASESPEPDFLREVFGVVRVAAVVEREQVDASLVTLRQLTEGFHVAALCAPDQFVFAGAQLGFPSRQVVSIDTRGADLVGREISISLTVSVELLSGGGVALQGQYGVTSFVALPIILRRVKRAVIKLTIQKRALRVSAPCLTVDCNPLRLWP